MFDTRIILSAVGVLTMLTNMITEVLKKLLWNIIPTNILVVLVAESLTLVSGFAYAQIAGSTILWYHVAAAVAASNISSIGFIPSIARICGVTGSVLSL